MDGGTESVEAVAAVAVVVVDVVVADVVVVVATAPAVLIVDFVNESGTA